MLSRIRSKKAGETATLTVVRKGEIIESSVKAIAKSDTNTLKLRSDISANGQTITEALGISVGNLTPEQRTALGLPDTVAAVVITGVKAGSQAAKRLQQGDLIHRINQDPVEDISTFYDLIGALPQDKTNVMVLSRDGIVFRAVLTP